MASALRKQIREEVLKCPVCYDYLTQQKRPKLLPCQHTFCLQCLDTLVAQPGNNDVFKCPFCNGITSVPSGGVTKFPSALTVRNLIDVLDTSETIEGQTGQASQTKNIFCPKHQTLRLKYYCEHPACQATICGQCIKPEHDKHSIIDIEEVSQRNISKQCKELDKEFMDAEKALMKEKEDIEHEIVRKNHEFDQNKKTIHERYLKMKQELQKQESSLIKEAEGKKSDLFTEFTHELKTIDKKLSVYKGAQNVLKQMSKCSIEKLTDKQKKFLQRAKKDLDEIIPSTLSIDTTQVTTAGDFLVDVKMRIKNNPQSSIRCFNGNFTSFILLDTCTVAWLWNTTSTDFFVYGKDSQPLKEKLEKFCPNAFRIASMKRYGNECLVITEKSSNSLNHIKILDIKEDHCQTITLNSNTYPCALAVDKQDEIIFTDLNKPLAIRRMTRSGVETIFEDTTGDILKYPWHITVNADNNIVVSDCEMKSLIIFNPTGQVIGTYLGFTEGNSPNPAGISTDDYGYIYVCDSYAHNLIKLDSNGQFLDYQLTHRDGLQYPIAVVANIPNQRLLIGQADGIIKY